MTGVIATIPRYQFSSSTGVPLALGTLTVYLANTTTPTDTWQDSALSTLNTNPVQLDSSGSCVLWLDSTKSYKFVLKNAAGATQWTQDNITGNDGLLRRDLAASSGSSLVGYLPAGAGAVATTVQGKLRESVSVKDFGAVLDGVTNDYAAWVAAVAALSDGDILYIDGPMYYTTPILLTKSINVVCRGDKSYFKPNVGVAEAFWFQPASLKKVSMVLNMYGSAGSCRNGILIDRVTESEFKIVAVVGATSYGVQTLGCLNCDIAIGISTNRSAPVGSGAAMPAKHLYIGASWDNAFKSCNASRFVVYFGGGGAGIETSNAANEGDFSIKGTIEGNTGKALAIVAAKGFDISNLHLESGVATNSTLTDCLSFNIGPSVENIGNATTIVMDNCAGFEVDGYTGGLNIAASCRNGVIGVVSINAGDSITNASTSVQQIAALNNLASTTNASGQVGEFNQENIFSNPFVDIWPDGWANAPLGFTAGGGGSTATWSVEVGITYPGAAGVANRKAAYIGFSVARPDLAFSAIANPIGRWASFAEDTWYSAMTAVYVASGQPNVDVYVFDGTAYVGIGSVSTKDAWVVVRGSVFVPAGITPKVVYRPASTGWMLIGGLSMVRGANPPRHLSDHGRREEYLVTNVTYRPSFIGQRALVGTTFYMAANTAANTDWRVLN